jgi:hypothetical protein
LLQLEAKSVNDALEQIVNRLEPFTSLNVSARARIARNAVLRRFDAGETLWLTGDTPRVPARLSAKCRYSTAGRILPPQWRPSRHIACSCLGTLSLPPWAPIRNSRGNC